MSVAHVPTCCRPLHLMAAALACLSLASPCAAQPVAQPTACDELLALVPGDMGFCLLVNDLRGHARKWGQAPWARSLRQSPLVKTVLESPEAGQLAALESELKKHLRVDWPTLRDDILGDAVVVAYRAGTPARPEQEQGLIAVRAGDAKRLAELVDRFNRLQKATGELKALQEAKHRGAVYQRRAHVRGTHFYYLRGPVLVVAGSETLLRQVIERDRDKTAGSSPWPARFRRAGADRASVTLGVNPRAFALFPPPAKNEKAKGFAGFWQALDGAFLTFGADAGPELGLVLQGQPAEMPAWAQSAFMRTPAPSVLWQHFPERSILTIADRTDFAGLAGQLLELMPASERRKLTEGIQGGLGLFTRLDLFRDLLPNIGPDWGICVLPPAPGAAWPDAISALAVKPGTGPEPVDVTLRKGVRLLTGIGVADHNRKNPTAPIYIESIKQGAVTLDVLRQDKRFPAGFRPACAIKDGFLLFATSPEAIARFTPRSVPSPAKDEALLLRLSPTAVGELLKLRRPAVVLDIRAKQKLSAAEAEQRLDHVIGLLDLFESITVSQHGEPGQARWTLRVQPRAPQPQP